MDNQPRRLPVLQKISLSLMAILVAVTFVGSNLHALLWQKSSWLVGTVLPAVVVDLTNEQRIENAATPLVRNEVLDEAARLKAEHMAKYAYFAHFSPNGVSPWHWFDKAGYRYAFAGENLAIHFTDSDEVVTAWMNSPAHRQNIVDTKFTEIGVGTAKGVYEGYKTVYVVQLFGTPAAAPVEPAPPAPATADVVVEEESLAQVTEPQATTPIETEKESEVVSTSTPEVEGEQVIATAEEDTKEPVETPPTPLFQSKKTDVTPLAQTEKNTADSPLKPRKNTVTVANDVVVIETPVIATSSGLVAAQVTEVHSVPHAGATISAVLTKPSELLQMVYLLIGSIVVLLLSLSVVLEARRLHLVQMAYGVMLLCGMGALWYAHTLLTSGAVVV